MNPFQELYQKNKLKGVSDSKATKEYSENSFLFKKYLGKSEFLNPYFSFRGRILSKIAFGSYRVGLESTEHEKSIELSLSMGFNVIDTSSNYGDGESESLIGKVLQKKIQKGELKRENVFIITKVGYIQGKNLEIVTELENTNRAFPEITYYQEGCYHCIHPFFWRINSNILSKDWVLKPWMFFFYTIRNIFLWIERNIMFPKKRRQNNITKELRALSDFWNKNEKKVKSYTTGFHPIRFQKTRKNILPLRLSKS